MLVSHLREFALFCVVGDVSVFVFLVKLNCGSSYSSVYTTCILVAVISQNSMHAFTVNECQFVILPSVVIAHFLGCLKSSLVFVYVFVPGHTLVVMFCVSESRNRMFVSTFIQQQICVLLKRKNIQFINATFSFNVSFFLYNNNE